MESFFSSLQESVLERRRWDSREQLALGHHHLDGAHLPPPPAATRLHAPVGYEILYTAAVKAADPINPASQQSGGSPKNAAHHARRIAE